MTGQGDERLAVQMMKLGAFDYLVKNSELLINCRRRWGASSESWKRSGES